MATNLCPQLVRGVSVVGLLLLGLTVTAAADTYPSRPIRIVVPYPSGSSGDIVARVVGQKLSNAWGQQVLVDNRSGANGMLATQEVARSTPDGYTILLGTDIQFSILPLLYKKLPYNPQTDFKPVAMGAIFDMVLVVPPKSPINSVADLIAEAKAKPGKLTFASAGTGSQHQLAMELIKRLAGIDLVHVPYKGGAQALPDLMAGRVDMMFVGYGQVASYVRSGQLKMVATGNLTRLKVTPQIPAVAETFPGFEVNGLWNFWVPARTPNRIAEKLSGAIISALKAPDVVEKLSSLGLEVVGGSPQELLKRTRADKIKWGQVIKDAGIKGE